MMQAARTLTIKDREPRRFVVHVVVISSLAVIAVFGGLRLRESRVEASPYGMRMVFEPETGTGAVSVHGKDYSLGSADGHSLTTCDRERDGNPVRGVYSYFDPATGYGDVVIEDPDGVGGKCATITTDRTILRHRTCERNSFAWDCDNWQDNLHSNARPD
jgi:hypothetical protein